MSVRTQIPEQWECSFVETNDIELHYCRSGGSGPPFVVSHGFSDDGHCRLDLARELGDEFDVVLYDARGHGRSDAPDEGYGAPERAADLLGLSMRSRSKTRSCSATPWVPLRSRKPRPVDRTGREPSSSRTPSGWSTGSMMR